MTETAGPSLTSEHREMQAARYEHRKHELFTERGVRMREACQERALVVELRRWRSTASPLTCP